MIRFVKFQPNEYAMKFRNGKVVKEGLGISFYYNSRVTSLVKIPGGSSSSEFIFTDVTADFQEITIQGQVSYAVKDPKKISMMMDFSLDVKTKEYQSEDPELLYDRISNVINVLAKKELSGMNLSEALKSSEKMAGAILSGINENKEIKSLGIEILGLSILSILPTPETAKALEAEVREQIQQKADDAIYRRRNSAVEQERIIQENELNTEIAVEKKKREKRETQIEADRMELVKRQEMEDQTLSFEVEQEEKRKDLTALRIENQKAEAEAKAFEIAEVMKSFKDASPDVIQALTHMGMNADRLIALAFQQIAGKAENIGQLNVTPDLLREMMGKRG